MITVNSTDMVNSNETHVAHPELRHTPNTNVKLHEQMTAELLYRDGVHPERLPFT